MKKNNRMVYGETTPIRRKRGFSRFLPLGIYSRHYLILLFPITVILLFVTAVFIERHFARVTTQMVDNLTPVLEEIADQIDNASTLESARAQNQPLLRAYNMSVIIPATGPIPTEDQSIFYDVTGQSIISTLRASLTPVLAIDLTGIEEKVASVYVATKFGVAGVVIQRRLLSPENPHQFLVFIIFIAILSVFISALLLKNQLRPIRQLADAAEAFGRGERVPLNLSGADEIRRATSTFLAMRNRIERQLSQMKNMMTSISHDLKTPLTRLRLGIEVIDDADKKQSIIDDIEVMSRMITEIHDFAIQGEGDDYVDVDPVAIARSAV
ncbi:MAG: HAMP domain-containing protein, partial [Rhodobacteraceae bacterium]|nr:HAMP domain-containing protein [Paracoccaceae bacterium]